MKAIQPGNDSNERVSEYLRLALAKLSQNHLSCTPVNYAIMYFYVSGKDVALSKRVDELLKEPQLWDEDLTQNLFRRFICECSDDEYQELRAELLLTVAQILGSIVDLAGIAAMSNKSLEEHVKLLASTKSPREVLRIASNIIADTRHLIQQSRDLETNLTESTTEISQLKDELDNARRMADTDALTGLYNRRGFDNELLRLLKKHNSDVADVCLLILDIDHFKAVNDNHGHLVGDKVLAGISRLLEQHMRGSDHLSRFGGEEFAILLRDTPAKGAMTVAENLRKAVQKLRLKHVKTGAQLGKVTISIGVACYRKGESRADYVDRCDKALYRAKSLGRNRTVLAD